MKNLMLFVVSILIVSCSSLEKEPAIRQKPSSANKKNKTSPTKQSVVTKLGQQITSTSLSDERWTQFRKSLQDSQWQHVMDLSENLLKEQLSPPQQVELYKGRSKAFEATEFYYDLFCDLQNQSTNPVFVNEREAMKQKSLELIQGSMLKPDLEKISDSKFDSEYKAAATFRLAQLALDEKNLDLARKNCAKAYNLSPTTDVGLRAKTLLEQLESSQKVASKTIGVVLPMTGKFSAISKKTLRGIQMGLGLSDNNYSTFKLAVVDSEGNPESARRGVDRLVKEDNVIAIIGSVLSKTSAAEASKASELGVPTITLSQKAGVTETSPNVFRNSLTSEMQVRHLIRTAMGDLGMKRFAILFPNDQYGIEYSNIFWDEVLARGGSITAAQVYSNKETDFRFVVQRLLGTYYLEDRADEYKFRLKEWSDALTKKNARTTPPDDLLPPVVDFDAIFIPDSTKSLGQIAAMLSYNGVRGGVKLLGTNLWNVPGLAKRVSNWSKDIFFVDSFVSTDPAFQNSTFVREYRALFNEEPGVFEIQGYDTALMLRQLISNGAISRETLSSSLAKVSEIPASLGKISMSPEREIQRPLVTLTLDNADIVPFKR